MVVGKVYCGYEGENSWRHLRWDGKRGRERKREPRGQEQARSRPGDQETKELVAKMAEVVGIRGEEEKRSLWAGEFRVGAG